MAEARIGGKLLALAFPQTFVNLSGESVARLVRRYGVEGDMSRVVVVHDELDLPPGRVKIKEGGGTAGHNGLESIRSHLHSGAFIRVRIGIGKPPGRQDGADFVLKPARQGRAGRARRGRRRGGRGGGADLHRRPGHGHESGQSRLDLAPGATFYGRRMTMTEKETHSCGCGCSAMTDVTEAQEPCGCGCECCGDGTPKTA